ncbi:MAG: hypothetical protein JST23_00530 [Bacteroidetes bacterium]|nr:hypothetical protein [Bacteroidota bacterium]
MSLPRKKILSVLLAGAFIAPLLYVIFLQTKQIIIRHEMKERLEEQMLHQVTVQKQDIHWTEKGKELRIDGRMFDAEEVEYHSDGSITVTGLYDEEETDLLHQLNKTCQQQNTTENQQMAHYLSFLLAMPEQPLNFDLSFLSNSSRSNAFNEMSLPSKHLKIPAPPPKLSIGNI